jgi:hypothetical protein
LWAHLWCQDLDVLHDFAARLGLRRAWFQDRPRFPHYDVNKTMHARAVGYGAKVKSVSAWMNDERALMVEENRLGKIALFRFGDLLPNGELVSVQTFAELIGGGDDEGDVQRQEIVRLLTCHYGVVSRGEDQRMSLTLFPRFGSSIAGDR